ncbi:MAG: hypothetical protein ACRC2K_09755 [Clostridium sp.]
MCLSARNFNYDEAENILSQYGIDMEEYLELSKSVFPEFTCTLESEPEC